jgi:hypothetical protein
MHGGLIVRLRGAGERLQNSQLFFQFISPNSIN